MGTSQVQLSGHLPSCPHHGTFKQNIQLGYHWTMRPAWYSVCQGAWQVLSKLHTPALSSRILNTVEILAAVPVLDACPLSFLLDCGQPNLPSLATTSAAFPASSHLASGIILNWNFEIFFKEPAHLHVFKQPHEQVTLTASHVFHLWASQLHNWEHDTE